MQAAPPAMIAAVVWVGAMGTILLTHSVTSKPEAGPAKLQLVPADDPAEAPVRDAVAARPVVFGLAPAPPARPAAPVAAPRSPQPAPAKLQPLEEAPPKDPTARGRWEWAYLWRKPAEYIVRHTWLGSPELLRRRMSDPDNVNEYLSMPLVRGTLESPTLVRMIASNKTIVGAFVNSPAMQNPRSAEELLTSPLVQRILMSRGVQGFVTDPGALAKAFANPELSDYLRRTPAAGRLFTQVQNGQTPGRKE
ncbi:MAG: hypothetical protein HY553_20840 [Elusimicrobia bacterium]|nr:hypothetical protein [Elusimicrobiota bacterium]